MQGSGERILVVEDEVYIAADIERSLTSLGYQVCAVVSTAQSAVEKVRTLTPDLVLTDIRLPGEMDGIDVAAYVRENLNIPVVFLTAYADEDTLSRAEITEPYGYVLKPFTELELRAAIRLALHRWRSANSGSVVSKNDKGTAAAESSEVYRFLREVEDLRSVDDSLLYDLSRTAKMELCSGGKLLACEGDEQVGGFIVAEGRVGMLKTSVSGRDLIVELLPPGDVFGLAVTVAWEPYPVTAKAQVKSRVVWFPKKSVSELLDHCPKFSRQVLDDVFSRLRDSHSTSRGLAHDRVEVRLATALSALVPRLAKKGAGETAKEIFITRQELADCIGSTVETVVRITKNLERAGVLSLPSRGRIVLEKPQELREIFLREL